VSSLRALISLDAPEIPYLDDPRELSVRDRSEHWRVLCDNLDSWQNLPAPERLRTLQVVAKLGFWRTLDKTMDYFDGDDDEPATRPLKHLHALARLQLDRTDADAAARIVSLNIDKATDVRLTAKARLSAALNLTAHYTKRGSVADAQQWREATELLYSSRPSADFPLVLHSAYWRGIAFLSFAAGDHAQTAGDLDRAEAAATQAVAEADEQDRLVAAENLLVLLGVRDRAAMAAGAVDAAESYRRRMISLDPLDSRFHLKLAYILREMDRTEEARAACLRAAELGAPVTVYARAQAARFCSV
jgi:tetratricopeptide (TPR) repeat protein